MSRGLLFILSLLFGLHHHVSTCEVKDGTLVVNCSSTGVTNVPRNTVVDQVRVLVLSRNHLETLEKNTFFDYSKLAKIDFEYNHIVSIDVEAFKHLVKLTYVNLSNNKLTVLPSTVFENNHLLKILDVSHNPLEELNATFIVSSSITNLLLNQCNITSLSADTFSGLTQLEELEMQFNHVAILPDNFLGFSQHLRQVYLNGNPLDVINSTVLSSKSVTQLDISFCQLKTIPSEFLSGLTQLKTLFLTNNSLQHLPGNFLPSFPKLRRLFLHGNPWHCDGYMEELLETKHDVIADYRKIDNCITSDGGKHELSWNLTHAAPPSTVAEDDTTAVESTTSPRVSSTTDNSASKRVGECNCNCSVSVNDAPSAAAEHSDDVAVATLVLVVLIFFVPIIGITIYLLYIRKINRNNRPT